MPVSSLARRLAVEKDGARPADAHDLPRRDLHQVPVLGSGGMVWPHRSQYSSWAAASVASFFSDSSRANRRSAEKAEKSLSPSHTTFSPPRSAGQPLPCRLRPRATGRAPGAAARRRPAISPPDARRSAARNRST